jgi:hypothetical protein
MVGVIILYPVMEWKRKSRFIAVVWKDGGMDSWNKSENDNGCVGTILLHTTYYTKMEISSLSTRHLSE